ncbi:MULTISPECIES: Rne/Rng family ribonuclease [unclassified Prochlorococcus]|uniref:Rne/Rng family ribonuclease n=1 Tax=unclassified Prochlorococcus TaxID=2627481 RepID=UPI0005337850|nr:MULTISPECIES: Rne/Rng family ribonuclease [unclassified Prochlorococcus]KGG14735.1 Cytoplasmic axial filament protein CafA and Ribonuclease G Ribonuclease E [Prochlorococcus sp. MIT 0602]KGG15836.1 Cytoplasmic axial filament protein CafA and Ribonuclease G Ribonuclease E [Prochlorococcus sp. MIT 0603]
MPQKIIVAEQERIAALLSDGRVDKLIVAQGRYQIGDVYLGTIENVLPGIDAAFVNIGASEKNGFIHVTDLGPLKIKQSAASITELLRPNQKVLVQVMKEPTGNKGPRLTGNLALPGRYLVLQPNGQGVNISRRINLENERNRLKALGVLIKPPGTGILIRSEAESVSEELIIDDLESLLKKWELIQQASDRATPPTLLSRDEDFIQRVLRDHINPELSEVILETTEGSDRAKKYLSQDDAKVTVQCHKQSDNILEHYKIDLAILNALKPRVDLPSGGYIIIEPTEALTVIDVNSGSFTRSSNSRETVLWTNCEAAIEIARQLKLRNIGGVIIIDFIDMESRRDQLQLLEYFTSAIKDDASRPQISQLTELGLVELTRKRQGQNIYELFSKECSNCSGLGHIANITDKDKRNPSTLNSNLIQNGSLNNDEVNIVVNNKNKINESTNENHEAVISNISQRSFDKENNLEKTNPKNEAENIIIEMTEEEEFVYSTLGLNPTLILEKQPININEKNSIQVVRKNNKIEKSINLRSEELEAEVQNLSNKMKSEVPDEINSIEGNTTNSNPEINQQNKVEVENISNIEMADSTDSLKPEAEDTRRRRRRSSNEKDNHKVDGIDETTTQDSNLTEQEAEDSRRRRRRSSAAT